MHDDYLFYYASTQDQNLFTENKAFLYSCGVLGIIVLGLYFLS